jgi:hypothetical protein
LSIFVIKSVENPQLREAATRYRKPLQTLQNMTKFFSVEHEFNFNIDIVEFKRVLTQNNFPKFTCRFENGNYLIESKISVGVVKINNFRGVGISTNLKLTGNNEKTVLNLKSSQRPEYIITILAFIVSFIAVCVKDFGLNLLWVILIFVIVFFWFRFIIQSQEEVLHENVKRHFRKLELEES